MKKKETDHTPTAFAAPLLWDNTEVETNDVENKNKWGLAKNSPTQHKHINTQKKKQTEEEKEVS